jgi:RNA recognition motif-containing protein
MLHRCLGFLALSAHALVSNKPRPSCIALRSSILSDDVFPSTATDVFVGNMPYGMSDDYVKDLVYTVRKDDGSPVNPEVLRVTVPRDEETGKDRGLAFVKVLDATQAADLSAALDGFEYRGRVLNSNVKESRKKKWVERPAVDPATLDDGGLFEALDTLPDKFAIQEYGLEKIRNACKKARIKAGGDLEQCTARLLKIRGLKPEVYLDPAFGLIPTRNNRRNARWN